MPAAGQELEARTAERAYDVHEAAAVKSVSPDFIRRALKKDLKAKRVGTYIRIRARDLDEWFDALPDA